MKERKKKWAKSFKTEEGFRIFPAKESDSKGKPIFSLGGNSWPYKFVVWKANPQNEKVQKEGLLFVKMLSMRNVKTNKIQIAIVYDYKSDEGLAGKEKSVTGIEEKDKEGKNATLSVEVAEKVIGYVRETIKKIFEDENMVGESQTTDFSHCKSFEECLDKMGALDLYEEWISKA